MKYRSRRVVVLIATLSSVCLLVLLATSTCQAGTVLETANMGSPGQTSGEGVVFVQYLGARFHVSETTVVDHIGGHFHGRIFLGEPADSTLFGAIAAIDGPGGFPLGSPTAFAPLASTAFTAPFPSDDVSTPLSVTLLPGDYALIFGSGRFGATGAGGMPTNNSLISPPSTFFNSFETSGLHFWREHNGSDNLRFTISGVTVPEPSTYALSALAVIALLTVGRRRLRFSREINQLRSRIAP